MRFDQAATTWDDDPIHVERAQQLAKRLIPLIQANQLTNALDFGAGTGLPGFFLTDAHFLQLFFGHLLTQTFVLEPPIHLFRPNLQLPYFLLFQYILLISICKFLNS